MQGGCLWEDVDVALAKHDLATVGGTVNHTGVGGLTLGGGYGYLSGKHGMVVDNLLAVEYVLADGSIVTASESENPDLFWAARGAGVNFGVVTSFTYRAHYQKSPVWGGLLIFPKEKLTEVVKAANQLIATGDGRNVMVVGVGSPPPAAKPAVIAVVFFDGDEDEAKAFYEPVLGLGPLVNNTSPMPYSSANAMLNPLQHHGLRRSMKGSGFIIPLDPTFAETLFNDYADFVQRVPNAVPSTIIFEYFPLEKIMSVSNSHLVREPGDVRKCGILSCLERCKI